MDLELEEKNLRAAVSATEAVGAAGGPRSAEGAGLVPAARAAVDAVLEPLERHLLAESNALAATELELKETKEFAGRARKLQQKAYALHGPARAVNDIDEGFTPEPNRPEPVHIADVRLAKMNQEIAQRLNELEERAAWQRGVVTMVAALRDAAHLALDDRLEGRTHSEKVSEEEA